MFQVNSPNVSYDNGCLKSIYSYQTTLVAGNTITPVEKSVEFKTALKVPKLGVMLVGWGGNNGTTVTAGILANKQQLSWRTREGVQHANYFGSITQASTVRLGNNAHGEPVYVPFHQLLPMVHPNDMVLGGWDISSMNLADAMERAKVLDYELQRQLSPQMRDLKPLPSIYFPHFIAANQSDRADNVLQGSHSEQLETVRRNIREFKAMHGLDKVIVLWTATTERYAAVLEGVNDTAENLLRAIEVRSLRVCESVVSRCVLQMSHSEVSPSTMFAVASILEHCSYINGSPQNTFVPGVVELAERHQVFIGGDDFKSGMCVWRRAERVCEEWTQVRRS